MRLPPVPTLRFAPAAVMLVLLWAQAAPVSGQASEGSATSAVGGGALGAFAGAALGLAGAMGPCNRALPGGPVCPRAAAVVGGAVGLAAGAVLGANDTAALTGNLEGAGYGALTGGLVGLGLSLVVRQYAWPDPLTFAVLGAAIGTSPEASGVGFAVGATVGALGWMAFSRVALGDAIAAAAVGVAVGGIVGWVLEARDSRSGPPTGPAVSFSVALPIPVP